MSTTSSPIERSNSAGRFTPADLAAKTRESRAFWQSPAGIKRKQALEIESRNRKPVSAPKYPQAQGLKPTLSTRSQIAIAAAKARR